MKILDITLKEFRQFHGTQTIKFARSDTKNITIIRGPNGSGKSNIMASIYFALYGYNKQNIPKNVDHKTIVSICNEDTLKNTKIGESVESSVVITLGTKDKAELRVRRDRITKKNTEQLADPHDNGPFVDEWDETKKDWIGRTPSTSRDIIAQRFPEAIANCFFFDGERLDAFFESDKRSAIKAQVHDISRIETLTTSIKNFKKHINGLVNDNPDVSKEYKDTKIQIENIKKKIKDYEQAEKDALGKKGEHEMIELNARTFLESDASKSTEQTSRDAGEKAGEIERLTTEIQDLEKDKHDLIRANAPYELTKDINEKLHAKIQEEIDTGKYPPDYNSDALKKLLESNICICGENITPTHKEKIQHLIDESSTTSDAVQMTLGSNILGTMINERVSFVTQLNGIKKEITEKQIAVEKAQYIHATLEKRLDTLTSGKDVKQKIKEERENQKQARDGISEESMNIGIAKKGIETEIKNLKNAEITYNSLKIKDEKHTNFSFKQTTLEETLKALENTESQVRNTIRDTLEKKTEEHFFKFVWKDYDKSNLHIKIDEDYTLYFSKDGRERREQLSAGEKECLALAFIAALNDFSDLDFPMVIDTPIARISDQPRENIARNLPIFLGDTQLTLLVTEAEFTDDVRQILDDKIAYTYQISHDGTYDKSTVKEIK